VRAGPLKADHGAASAGLRVSPIPHFRGHRIGRDGRGADLSDDVRFGPPLFLADPDSASPEEQACERGIEGDGS